MLRNRFASKSVFESHSFSLNANKVNLIPIKVYKENEDTETIKTYSDFVYERNSELVQKRFEQKSLDLDLDELLNRKSCYYDIKIRNEHNELLDYKLVNSNSQKSLRSKMESHVSYEVNKSYNSNKQIDFIQSTSSLSSSSLLLSSSSYSEKRNFQRSSESIFISKEDSEFVSSIGSSTSNESSCSSLNAISHEQVELNHSTANSSALKVEYVPSGKIITINVSIMWWSYRLNKLFFNFIFNYKRRQNMLWASLYISSR